MDLATVIGLVGAFAFIVIAMFLGGDLSMYFDWASLFIVLGGSVFVVLMKYSFKHVLTAGRVAGKAFMFRTEDPLELIQQLVTLADKARKGGFLVLEDENIEQAFLKKGVDLLVDGLDEEALQQTLRKDIALTEDRHEKSIGVFHAIADVAPAMGMIGTLIGLVAMLSNMDDPKAIGPAMAVALLTTLYGSMLANMVALPIADKLTLRKEQESLNRQLICDGVLAIFEGKNPRNLEQYLKNYLHEKQRKNLDDPIEATS